MSQIGKYSFTDEILAESFDTLSGISTGRSNKFRPLDRNVESRDFIEFNKDTGIVVDKTIVSTFSYGVDLILGFKDKGSAGYEIYLVVDGRAAPNYIIYDGLGANKTISGESRLGNYWVKAQNNNSFIASLDGTGVQGTGSVVFGPDSITGSIVSGNVRLEGYATERLRFAIGSNYSIHNPYMDGAQLRPDSYIMEPADTTSDVTFIANSSDNSIEVKRDGQYSIGKLIYNPLTQMFSGACGVSVDPYETDQSKAQLFNISSTPNGGIVYQSNPSQEQSNEMFLKVITSDDRFYTDNDSGYICLSETQKVTAGIDFPIDRKIYFSIYGAGGGGGGGRSGAEAQYGHGGFGGIEGEYRTYEIDTTELNFGDIIEIEVGNGGLGGIGATRPDGSGYNVGTDGSDGEQSALRIPRNDGSGLNYDIIAGGGSGGKSPNTGSSGVITDGTYGNNSIRPLTQTIFYPAKGGEGGDSGVFEAPGINGKPGIYPAAGGGGGGGGGAGQSRATPWPILNYYYSSGSGADGGDGARGFCFVRWGERRSFRDPEPEKFPSSFWKPAPNDGGACLIEYEKQKMLAYGNWRSTFVETYEGMLGEIYGEDITHVINGQVCYKPLTNISRQVVLNSEYTIKFLKDIMQMDDDDIENIKDTHNDENVQRIDAYYLNNFTFTENDLQTVRGYVEEILGNNGIVALKLRHSAYAYANGTTPLPRTILNTRINIATSSYNNEVNYGETAIDNVYIYNGNSYSVEIPNLIALDFNNNEVAIEDYERSALFAMLLISKDTIFEPRGLPVSIGNGIPTNGLIPHIQEETFDINMTNWIDVVEYTKYNLVNTVDDSEVSGDSQRRAYMLDDYSYNPIYLNMFWQLRDIYIRGSKLGFLEYDGGEYNNGFVSGGKFHINVEEVKTVYAPDIISTIGQTFEFEVIPVKRKSNGLLSLIIGIVLIVISSGNAAPVVLASSNTMFLFLQILSFTWNLLSLSQVAQIAIGDIRMNVSGVEKESSQEKDIYSYENVDFFDREKEKTKSLFNPYIDIRDSIDFSKLKDKGRK